MKTEGSLIGAGVYEIRNTVTGEAYVGATNDLKARERTHRYALRSGKAGSYLLQEAWNRDGEPAFLFRVLVNLPEEDCVLGWRYCERVEEEYIRQLQPAYNVKGKPWYSPNKRHEQIVRAHQ